MKKMNADPPTQERRREQRGRRLDDFALPNFQDLTDNAVQGILVHANFRPLYVNAAFAQLFGYDDVQDITKMPLVRPLVPADLWPQIESNYHDFLRGGTKATISRTRGLHRDGHEIWLSVTQRIIDWHGQIAVQINVFDISQQVAMEELMLEKEQVFSAMLEILPVPVYIERQKDGRILFVNRKTCLLFQQSAGPLLHAKAIDFYASAEDHLKLRELLCSVRDIREVEVPMKSAQGRSFTAEMAAIMMDYAGEHCVLVALNDISQRKQLEIELFAQANTDALTGISNRRSFIVQAEQEMRRVKRFERDLSVIMMDLDHFKSINDRYGHAVGDAVLMGVVKAAQQGLREADVMGRLGGEEFAVLLPETDLAAAMETAERLRNIINCATIKTDDAELQCTASLGVAQLDTGDETIDDLLRRADKALYRAKMKGRNRVEVAT